MPINYITINVGKTLGSQLLDIVSSLRILQDKLREHKEIMDNMTDGTTWSGVETQYGTVVGKGDDLYNLVAGAVSELSTDTNFSQMVDWIVPEV